MANDIMSSNPKPPTPQIVARAENAATDYDEGGWKPIFKAHNTNEHHKRAVAALDFSGSPILTSTSKIARYHVKCVGQSGNTEQLAIRLWGIRQDGGTGTPSFEVQADIAGGASLGPEEFNGGSDTAGAWWEIPGLLNIVHDQEYQELQIQIATKQDMSKAVIHAVEAYWVRDRTTAFARVFDNGFTPQDVDQADASKYSTGGRNHDLHDGCKIVAEEHTSQVCSSSRPEAPIDPEAIGGFAWTGTAPEGVTKARFIVRGRRTVGDSNPYTWTVTSDAGGSKEVSPTSETMANYGPYDLTVKESREIRFELAATDDTEIEGLSMWWGDAAYDG